MLLKPEVKPIATSNSLWYGLGVAEFIHFQLFQREMVVTSMNDGTHMEHSFHYRGQAADLRAHDLTGPEQTRWFNALKSALYSLGFDVLLEIPKADGHPDPLRVHIHLEYDPKPGRTLTDRAV